MQAIIYHEIDYIIDNVANQLFFAFWDIIPELRVFVISLIQLIKIADFICAFKKKQEIWHKMMILK